MRTPTDHLQPNWAEYVFRIPHEWRNYISNELADMWDTFTPLQKAALARQAQSQADNEEWD